MFKRFVISAFAVVGYSMAMALYNPVATVVSAEVAGHQFDNSDTSYVATSVVFSALHGVAGYMTLALLVALVAIWFTPIKTFVNETLLLQVPDKSEDQ